MLGHEAYSCDLQIPSGGRPEWHIRADCREVINGDCRFLTMNGDWHMIFGSWDLIIAHPPCTYLTTASAVHLFSKDHHVKDIEREAKGWRARAFFMSMLEAECPRIAVENPLPLSYFNLPRYTQIIEPYMFGDPWRKRTCLWLKGLPKLEPANVVEPKGLWVGSTSANRDPAVYTKYQLHSDRSSKRRARTFPGIARAMAVQWGNGALQGGDRQSRN